MKATIEVVTDIARSVRVQQVEGIFDVEPSKQSKLTWEADLPIEEREWSIGLICGPSGCGKTTVARRLFGDNIRSSYPWPDKQSILDGFPKGMGIKDITSCLSSVGLSSPPAWLRPYDVLSNGEQFRVNMARVLADSEPLTVVDEFTSVVDRVVAQLGSSAVAKSIRRRGKKFIAVSCHMDIEEWLQPDWVFLPAEGKFIWRSVQPRPAISLTINRTTKDLWRLFKHHHYMTGSIASSAFCFVAYLEGRPVAFDAWLPFVGRLKTKQKAMRGHRTVVLPDYQGVGIGRELFDRNASLFAGLGYRAFSGTGHPAEIANRQRNGKWVCIRAPGMSARDSRASLNRTRATDRLRASFEYTGPKMTNEQAKAMFAAWNR